MANTQEKRYPFSMKKYGHDVEFAYNHWYILCQEMENGERVWDDKTFDYYDKLDKIFTNASCYDIYWATGDEFSILSNAHEWAEAYRHSH